MSLGLEHWKGRRKNALRRKARDLRELSPFMGVALCVLSSATFIFVAERLGPDQVETLAQTLQARAATTPLRSLDRAYLTISSSSTSNAMAAPAGMRPAPRLP